jgi:hypothetical protein
MVSDGSELAQHMTFGWVLCLNDGTRLALCSGPAFGKGSSHRAEATGMLSGARFLYHLTQFCAQPITRPTTFTTDNRGLLTRIRQRNEYITNFATATLAPDWDLVEDLHRALSHFPLPPEFAHVKGHQDEKQSYDKLTLPAQLNVDADHAAGNFQWNHAPTLRGQVLLSPHTHAQLNIAGHTISGHYRHHIRTAASQDAFFAKCREIHEWTPTVFQFFRRFGRPCGIRARAPSSPSNFFTACSQPKRPNPSGIVATLVVLRASRMTLSSTSCNACTLQLKHGAVLFSGPSALP